MGPSFTPDVREWLPEDHFAWFVLDAVAAMDLEAFYCAYRVDGRARPVYAPAMMVALILYAYARGIRSSRAIERACSTIATRRFRDLREAHPAHPPSRRATGCRAPRTAPGTPLSDDAPWWIAR
jgi:hypothetical protein